MLNYHNLFKILFLWLFIGCSQPEKEAEVKTVDIKQTQAKHQGATHFCWSYALHGMLESMELERGGSELNLSEEYLGFYHMYEQLLDYILNPEKYQDYAILPLKETNNYQGAFEVASKWGMVPESEFKVKFEEKSIWVVKSKDKDTRELSQKVRDYFEDEIFENQGGLAAYSEKVKQDNDILLNDLWEIFKKSSPTPDEIVGHPKIESFSFKDQTHTTQSFAKEVLKFNGESDFKYWQEKDVDQGIDIIKKILLQQIAIPMRYSTGWRKGHILLAVDFVTEEGEVGQMSKAEIESTFNNPLKFILVKDSIGSTDDFTHDGKKILYQDEETGETTSYDGEAPTITFGYEEEDSVTVGGYRKLDATFIIDQIKKGQLGFYAPKESFEKDFETIMATK